MKQVTFSQSQWDMLLAALVRVKVHEFNQWSDWRDNQMSILLAGMDLADYQRSLDRRWDKYSKLQKLYSFLLNNARDIEEDKA